MGGAKIILIINDCYMKAKIISRREIAKDTIEVEFDLLGAKPFFESGQYFFLNLLKPKYEDKKGKERHFSIINTPNEKGIIRMATRVTDSAFKQSLNEMEIGTVVGIHTLAGGFVLPDRFKKLVFIAGGIGITPFMNFIQYIKEERLDYDVVLLYSNRDQLSTAYFQELKKYAEEMSNLELILIMTNDEKWEGEREYIDEKLIPRYVEDYQDRYFMVAGPPGMTKAMNVVLHQKLKISPRQTNIEEFIGY